MRLSIIIPVYQVEHTLDRCVESVLRQPFSDWEMILVDDGSSDRSPSLCDRWAQADSRIRTVHQSNGGLSAARNTGIELAQGDYLTFIDSDDWIEGDPYGILSRAEGDAALIEYPVEADGHRSFSPSAPTLFTDMERYWLDEQTYEHCYAWNKLYRRDLFQEVRYPVGRVFEDVAVLPPLLRRADTLRLSTQGLYHYENNPQGITRQATGRELLMLLEHHLDTLPLWSDDRYYMHVLNIQIDVVSMLGTAPILPFRRVWPWAEGLSLSQRLKAAVLCVAGVKGVTKLWPLISMN